MMTPDKPKRVVSQALVKETKCFGGCGLTVHYRTTPRVYCEPCKIERKRASSRVGMEKQRRKNGIPAIKGTSIKCEKCGIDVVRNRNAQAKFCRPCYLICNGAESVARSAAKRATTAGREYANAWHRQQRATRPDWRVSGHVRTLMQRGLGRGKAGRSWRSFVPYTLEELMAHLERQFTKGMTWANRGEWHIDHIVPLSSFSFTSPDDPEFKAAWALSNLRPLWAVENLQKNARRTHLL